MFYDMTRCRSRRYRVLMLCELTKAPPQALRQTVRSGAGQLGLGVFVGATHVVARVCAMTLACLPFVFVVALGSAEY